MFLTMIRRRVVTAFVLAAIFSAGHGQSKPGGGSKAVSKPAASPSFTERVLKFLGISDSPSTLKGPGDEVVRGEVWIADRRTGTTRAVTLNDGYRSPVFIPGENALLAMLGDNLVRLALAGQQSTLVSSHGEITKLIGYGLDDPDKVLVLLRGSVGGHPHVGSLSLATNRIQAIPYDPKSTQDLQMIESLQGWSRTYGADHVYVQRQTKDAMSGTMEWTDVFVSSPAGDPVNLSKCNGQNCGQPALSQDAHLVAFVKSRSE